MTIVGISFPAHALTKNQILDISNRVATLTEQGAAAANRGDLATACKKAEETATLWFRIDPRDVPPKAIPQFYIADIGVKNIVVQSYKFCSKY